MTSGDDARISSLAARLADGAPPAEQAEMMAELADRLACRYESRLAAGDPESALADLRELVRRAQPVLATIGTSHPLYRHLALAAGYAAEELWDSSDDAGDRDRAIDNLESALATSEPDGCDALALFSLTRLLTDRVSDVADLGDLDELIGAADRLLRHPDTSPEDIPLLREVLADALVGRAELDADRAPADLSTAIGHWKSMLAAQPASAAGRGEICGQIALAYGLLTGGDDSRHVEIDEMTRFAEQAWRLLPPDHDLRVETGIHLVAGLHELLRRPGQPFDKDVADRAIGVLTILEPGVRVDGRLHLTVIVELALFLIGRGQATGSTADLAAAEPWVSQALGRVRPGDPEVAATDQHNLAVCAFLLACLRPDLGWLRSTITLLTAISREPAGDPASHALLLGALGTAQLQLAAYQQDSAGLDAGIACLRTAFDATLPGDPYRLVIAWNLGSALLTRFMRTGDLQDQDAARHYLTAYDDPRSAPLGRDFVADFDFTTAATRGLLAVAEGAAGDTRMLTTAVSELRSAAALLPPGHPYEQRIRGDLGMALTLRAIATSDLAEIVRAADELTDVLSGLPAGHMMRPYLMLHAGAALAQAGASGRDPARLRSSIKLLSTAVGEVGPEFGGRVRLIAMLGAAWAQLHDLTGDRAALAAALRRLQMACAELSDQPHRPERAPCLVALARLHFSRGARADARKTGLAALRARGCDVLLQTGTSRALRSAEVAGDEAIQVATWCLSDGSIESAIEALELGRGLLLHAATSTAGVPELLARAGRADLAREWRAAQGRLTRSPWDQQDGGGLTDALLTARQAPEVPDDLRARVLAALSGPDLDRLVAPPDRGMISAALAATRADALVYLLGASHGQAGCAIVVSADSSRAPELLPLPGLDGGRGDELIDACLGARVRVRAARGSGRPGADRAADTAIAEWEDAIQQLCAWAWPGAVDPLLGWLTAEGLGWPASLVLVPVGKLSTVPWHAARAPGHSGSGGRYACEAIAFSYAASARQLADVARRSSLELRAAPVVVGNPTMDLTFAGIEAQAIRDTYYPRAPFLGYASAATGRPADGPADPADVLVRLPSVAAPGASMIHFACHATAMPAQPGRSYLMLSGGSVLPVEQILRQADQRAPDGAGGLICLAACESDLADGHYDEALTLATAFLAAGAVTVVGARWELPEGSTALMMYMLHHYLARGESPRAALRHAQLWMLDPDRRPPPGLPAPLAAAASQASLSDVGAWGALTHQGR